MFLMTWGSMVLMPAEFSGKLRAFRGRIEHPSCPPCAWGAGDGWHVCQCDDLMIKRGVQVCCAKAGFMMWFTVYFNHLGWPLISFDLDWGSWLIVLRFEELCTISHKARSLLCACLCMCRCMHVPVPNSVISESILQRIIRVFVCACACISTNVSFFALCLSLTDMQVYVII